MEQNRFNIVDCTGSDQPRYRKEAKYPGEAFAVSVGIIGGASGPATLILGHPDYPAGKPRVANSSLHFDPVEEIEWRIVFHQQTNEDLTVSLI